MAPGTKTTTPKATAAGAATSAGGRNIEAELAYLTRVLKAPSLHAAAARLAERARDECWTHEEFLAACLQREVAARQAHGGEARIRSARFPARKALEDFDFDHQRSARREVIAHLGTLDFVAARENVVFLGPPGTGKTHLSIGLGIRACQAGHRVAFATAAEWVARLADAHAAGRLQDELTRLARVPVLIVDEVGYIPFEAEAANLFFQLVSSRYERASLIVTSNKPFGRWGEVFGDDVVAAAMIDRLVHHRRGHQPEGRQLPPQEPRPGPRPRGQHHQQRAVTTDNIRGSTFRRRQGVRIRPSLTQSLQTTLGGFASRASAVRCRRRRLIAPTRPSRAASTGSVLARSCCSWPCSVDRLDAEVGEKGSGKVFTGGAPA
ncbi:IS21-like element helper ATPase IstB [Actinomadura sp. GC306]|uniref:IS21-like element helper ATPase IstB n=1 Tax=Actinomadura sp. GC306 TaxID=2530367 RepID=UPI0024433C90|nr:IS21-like element helper ATPase IstB [Actinomadura sp. GC306]